MAHNMNSYKGYSLFSDVDDRRLRVANQGVTMANIYEDNCAGNVITERGAVHVLGYMSKIPADDRSEVKKNFTLIMQERGFLEVK